MAQFFATLDRDGRATGFYRDDIHSEIPSGALPISAETHAAWIADAQGQRWDGAGLVPCDPPAPPPPTAEEVLLRRNELLRGCDWTQLADAPLTEQERQAWWDYRQALRDVPEQPGFPANVTWPEPPVSD